MKFDGLIISDGMEMNAIKDYYGIAEGSVMALKAGCDILLLCHNYEDQKLALESVMKAYKEGIITRSLLEDKVNRINKAKEKVLLGLEKYFTSDIYKVVEEEHNLMQDIVDNSYTLIKGTPPYINNNTLVISSSAKVGSIVEDEFDDRNLTNALKHNFPNNKVLKFEKNDLFKDEVYKVIDNYDHILIYSYDAYCDETQKEVINTILQLDKEVHVVSIKGPIDMNHFINLTNYSCLYEYTPNSIKTIVKQLKGEITLNGKLPN
jgi:beta-N-acetylhexosaminidase